MIENSELVACKTPEIESCMKSLHTITDELEEIAKTLIEKTKIICYDKCDNSKPQDCIADKKNTVLGQDIDFIYWRLRAVYGSLLYIKQSLEI